jgi:hypothetical protein
LAGARDGIALIDGIFLQVRRALALKRTMPIMPAAATLETPTLSPSARLLPDDVPVGEPLAWSIVTADGVLLLEMGAIIPSEAARSFLFAHFEPFREDAARGVAGGDGAHSFAPTSPDISNDPFTLDDIGLKIGARLGVRRQAATAMYSSRVIGFSSAGPHRPRAVFVTQPVMSGNEPLDLTRGDEVELVAITPRAVFHFVCTVDAVCRDPFDYFVLSEPGSIRRLRSRRFMRMPTHLPARFADADSGNAPLELGLVRDISPFGMSLAVHEPRAKLGDRLRVSFHFNTDETDVEVDCRAIVRHVNPADANGAQGAYGLEFESLDPSQRIALKSFMAEKA